MKSVQDKGIIYCRVSSQEQIHGTSLDNQEQACLEYAKRKGIKVLKIFVERGESATAADRTEFLKAVDFCRTQKGKVAAFIIWKVDRFARNVEDHYAVRAKLLQYGTMLHSVTENLTRDPAGKVMEAMLAAFAEFENDTRKARCESGMQRKIQEGIRPWTPPIGYTHSKQRVDKRKTMPDAPDDERFAIIQRGFREYAKGGVSITALTKLFNEWGIRTRTGKPFRVQLVEKMLSDKFYAGILVDPWTGNEYQGKHIPMIAPEEYSRIQYVKENYSRGQNIPHLSINPDFPLRRLVRCPCGRLFTASWRKGRRSKYPYYHCPNPACKHYTHGVPKTILEAKFVDLLAAVTPTQKFLKVFQAVVLDEWQNRAETIAGVREGYKKELVRLSSKKEELIQMRMNKEISKEEFIEMRDRLENQMTAVKISMSEAGIDELDMKAAISYAKQFLGNLVRNWRDAKDIRQKQRFQRLVFPEGLIYDKTADTFGTAVLSPVLWVFRNSHGESSELVAGPGIAPGISRLCVPSTAFAAPVKPDLWSGLSLHPSTMLGMPAVKSLHLSFDVARDLARDYHRLRLPRI